MLFGVISYCYFTKKAMCLFAEQTVGLCRYGNVFELRMANSAIFFLTCSFLQSWPFNPIILTVHAQRKSWLYSPEPFRPKALSKVKISGKMYILHAHYLITSSAENSRKIIAICLFLVKKRNLF